MELITVDEVERVVMEQLNSTIIEKEENQ